MTAAPALATPRTATYHRYLDAAEQAFIHDGYEGASIRRISGAAGAPLGTLHHYWGNKAVLFREVCERRFEPIQAEQLRRLQAVSEAVGRAAGSRPRLEAVVRALVEPPMLAASGDATAATIRLLYGRALTEPSEVVKRIVRELFLEATQRFRDLLRAACPQLEPEVFYWRMTCALGAFIFAQSFGDRVGFALPADAPRGEDWPAATNEIVGFILRGMGLRGMG